MSRFRVGFILLGLFLLPCLPGRARVPDGPAVSGRDDPAPLFYVDSRGRRVPLREAPDRVLVVAAPGRLEPGDPVLQALGVAGVQWLGAAAEAQAVLRFDPSRAGDPVAAARTLERLGRVSRVGRSFLGSGGAEVFHLDREVVLALREPSVVLPDSLAAGKGILASRPIDRRGFVHVARTRDADAALAAATALAGRPEVRWAVPDFVIPYVLHGAPADPLFPRQWHLLPGPGGIDVQGAWELVEGAPGRAQITVAVIDTGLDTTHAEFAGRVVPGWDTLGQDPDPWPGTKAIHAHGTHCAGLIGAARDGRGVVGVCPECRLMGVRFLEGFGLPEYWGQLSTGAEALRRAADAGAEVLSNSWGIQPVNKQPFRPDGVDMVPLLDAARYAARTGRNGRGAVVVFSSGNERGEPMAEDDLAALPEVIAVGATGPDDAVLPYSQGGPNLSITAPSNAQDFRVDGILREGLVTTDTTGAAGANKGDGAHYTSAVYVDKKAADLPEDDPTGDTTRFFAGTSAAAPLVAGTAALMLSVAPDLSPGEVRRILEATADRPGGVSFDADGHDDRYGHGRLNARRAVAAARFGLGTVAPGGTCADDVNCAVGPCDRDPGTPLGRCAPAPPVEPGEPGIPVPEQPDPGGPATELGPPEAGPADPPVPERDPGTEGVLPDPDGPPRRDASSPGDREPEARTGAGGCSAGLATPYRDPVGGFGWMLVVLGSLSAFRFRKPLEERAMSRHRLLFVAWIAWAAACAGCGGGGTRSDLGLSPDAALDPDGVMFPEVGPSDPGRPDADGPKEDPGGHGDALPDAVPGTDLAYPDAPGTDFSPADPGNPADLARETRDDQEEVAPGDLPPGDPGPWTPDLEEPDSGPGNDLDVAESPDPGPDADPGPDSCVPACTGRQCGPDGCGGLCGLCPDHHACIDGACILQPWCGDGSCNAAENCLSCPQDCPCGCGESCDAGTCRFTACTSRQCGPDGCGGLCGTCPDHHACIDGLCILQPWCGDGSCNAAEDCLSCPQDCPCGCGESCDAGTCRFTACTGRQCGPDGCGGLCGTCPDHHACIDGLCILQPWCGDRSCNGAENCLSCPADCPCGCGESCDAGTCRFTACTGRQCGPDGCGGLCGTCPDHHA
ncbi:S8 family serine peptidase, partial [Myxococcota bacterium]|nr:S8 family serine peptidase [Myxococcota bacterium]